MIRCEKIKHSYLSTMNLEKKRLKNGRSYREKTVAKMGQRTLVCNREINSNLQRGLIETHSPLSPRKFTTVFRANACRLYYFAGGSHLKKFAAAGILPQQSPVCPHFNNVYEPGEYSLPINKTKG
jgi:hypothetical protein